MDADYTELMNAALTHSDSLPLESRARIYRAAGRLLSDAKASREFADIAQCFLDLDARCRAAKSKFLHFNP